MQMHPEDPLFALHAATEVTELWSAVRALLRGCGPCARVTLFLGHLGWGEARTVLTDPQIERSDEWFAQRAKANPFSPFIQSHPGLDHYLFEQVVGPPAAFRRTRFYRDFASAEGWDKGFSGMFWNRQREMRAMFSLYRSPRQRRFSEEDIARLRSLMPYIEVAISRVQRFQEEKLQRRMMEAFNRELPVPVVLLDWSLKPLFANREAYRAAARWNYGPKNFRPHANPEFFRIPGPVLQAARQLKERILSLKGDAQAIGTLAPVSVFHPESIALAARVSAAPGLLQSVARPGFFVLFDDSLDAQPAEPDTASRLKLLSRLSVAERELVHHLCLGLGNREIAARLNKSVLTVKTQLSAIYGKLNVPGRTRLMALLQTL